MFLNRNSDAPYDISVCRIVYRSLWLTMLILAGVLQTHAAVCSLEVPVYDASGNKLAFRVSRVSPEGKREINLLTVMPNLVSADGSRISFPDDTLLRRVIVITLEGANGQKVVRPILLMQCPQRASVRVGEFELYGDVLYVTIRGRASGCRFSGDWWIRAMPMFGANSSQLALDGYVQPDGTFALSGQIQGERYLVVFGKDKRPVKAIGVDVTVGKDNNVGIVDLAGSCP